MACFKAKGGAKREMRTDYNALNAFKHLDGALSPPHSTCTEARAQSAFADCVSLRVQIQEEQREVKAATLRGAPGQALVELNRAFVNKA